MSVATPTPERHAHRAELAARAWTEALAMTGARTGPRTGSHPDRNPCPTPRPPGDLVAAALRTHSALTASLGRNVPVTGLEPGGCGVRRLATFLAVYAGHYRQQDASVFGTAT